MTPQSQWMNGTTTPWSKQLPFHCCHWSATQMAARNCSWSCGTHKDVNAHWATHVALLHPRLVCSNECLHQHSSTSSARLIQLATTLEMLWKTFHLKTQGAPVARKQFQNGGLVPFGQVTVLQPSEHFSLFVSLVTSIPCAFCMCTQQSTAFITDPCKTKQQLSCSSNCHCIHHFFCMGFSRVLDTTFICCLNVINWFMDQITLNGVFLWFSDFLQIFTRWEFSNWAWEGMFIDWLDCWQKLKVWIFKTKLGKGCSRCCNGPSDWQLNC